MTGAAKGACEDVTGTPYVGADQHAERVADVDGLTGTVLDHATADVQCHVAVFVLLQRVQSGLGFRREVNTVGVDEH